ncbi:MAG: selenoprotein [Herminiimonas sp.]|nr:selenoprotein [Herminiimonas sp.]
MWLSSRWAVEGRVRCAVHDTIEFEKRGIPAAVIVTAVFSRVASFQFSAKGMKDHPYVEFPHPVSNLNPDQMQELTIRYVGEVVRQLTT